MASGPDKAQYNFVSSFTLTWRSILVTMSPFLLQSHSISAPSIAPMYKCPLFWARLAELENNVSSLPTG